MQKRRSGCLWIHRKFNSLQSMGNEEFPSLDQSPLMAFGSTCGHPPDLKSVHSDNIVTRREVQAFEEEPQRTPLCIPN